MLNRKSLLKTALICVALPILPLFGQGSAPNAGLIYLQTIQIPNWNTSGSSQANYDLFAFNPGNRVMYIGDRTNRSVTAIDTKTNAVIGVLPVPAGGSTNGVLVVPELQQLVVTDNTNRVFVYDLRVPGLGPDTYVLPGIKSGTDALDYDPLNRTVYVINGSAPYFITGIDLVNKNVASQLQLPGSPELLRFNPVDGLIYQVITDGDNKNQGAGVVAYDPVSNTIRATYLTPNCVPHGIDIDPVSNTALLGCGTNQAQVMLSLLDGKVLKTFPDVTGTDLLQFDPNNRRFYVGASGNQSTTSGCSADTTKAYPIIGVIDARGPVSSGVGRLVGVQCAGRNAKLGVDPIQNFIYVGTRQYPADPSDPNNGQAGVSVFYDPAPSQPLTNVTQAIVSGNDRAAGVLFGTLQVRPQGRGLRATLITNAIAGTAAVLALTTTVGYEAVQCGIDPGTRVAFCDGPILGDPLIGGVATLGIDGAPVGKGTLAAVSADRASVDEAR